MSTQEQTEIDELARAERLIEEIPRLPEIESIAVRLYEDWSGDPALYITFRTKPRASNDDAFFRRFNAYTHQISRKILHSGIARFPYTRLETAR